MYEKNWFSSPPYLNPNATADMKTEHRHAVKSHERVTVWMAKNKPNIKHAVVAKGGEFLGSYDLSKDPPKMTEKIVLKTKAAASPFVHMVAEVALAFASRSQAEAEKARTNILEHTEPVEAVNQVDVTGHKSAAKKEPAKVYIKGRIRDQLKVIFKKVPHVSATNAHKQIVNDAKFLFNMWVRYNVSEERCKRLFSSWTKRSSGGKAKTKLTGWRQWGVTRLRVFAVHFDGNAPIRGKNKDQLVNMLPPFEDKHNLEMLKVGVLVDKGAQAMEDGESSDDDSGDEMEGGEERPVSTEATFELDALENVECGEEGIDLAQAISFMLPTLPKAVKKRITAIPKKRKTPAPKKPIKKKKKRDKAGDEQQMEFFLEVIRSGPEKTGINKGKYEVKWEGYSTDENTWEPPENLTPDLIAEYEEGCSSDASSSNLSQGS